VVMVLEGNGWFKSIAGTLDGLELGPGVLFLEALHFPILNGFGIEAIRTSHLLA
jgi:hypothetical protein